MSLDIIEILAAILILIAVVKIVMLIIKPKIWLNFVEKIYSTPTIITGVGFLLSVLVLYFIVNAGISIIEILAVCLFIALLMVTGLANYADEFFAWLRDQDVIKIVKRLWLYSAMWLFLMVWGAYTLLSE